jgi:hypothetical protein
MKHYPYLSNNNPMTIFFFDILIQVEKQKEIFSGIFFTSMFETTVNDASGIPYYVDMIVEHEDYGIVTSSMFNTDNASDSKINGIFFQ